MDNPSINRQFNGSALQAEQTLTPVLGRFERYPEAQSIDIENPRNGEVVSRENWHRSFHIDGENTIRQ